MNPAVILSLISELYAKAAVLEAEVKKLREQLAEQDEG